MTSIPLTDQQLNDIDTRANAATAGPWCTDSWEIYQGTEYEPGISTWIGETCRGMTSLSQDRADAEFVAAARTDVPALLAEVRRLRAALAKEEHLHGETIDDRDQAQEIADKLAYAVAPEEVIGEHSSMNCPWTNAFELITPAAEVDKLRRERDLAIAHDQQPYPTAWAYEQACKALEKHRERADKAEAVIAEARAQALRDAAEICDEAGAVYGSRGANDAAGAAFALMERFLRKANEAEYVATPCDFVACEPGGEPCNTHERLMAHGEGDHELCGPDCTAP